jgi:hypothetical protein
MTDPQPSIDWEARAAEQAEQHQRRQATKRATRAEFKAARDAGLRSRHAAKLARLATEPREGPCGCTSTSWCPQHWQALPTPEKRDWRRRHPGQPPTIEEPQP